VGIYIDNTSFCSASVLSEHYLLTAAHCVANTADGYGNVTVRRANSPGTSHGVYTGRAQFLTHRDYERGAALDPEDDIALVRLRDGGVNLSLTGRARIYIDYVSPIWTRSDPQSFTFAGWGLTDPNGNAQCTSGSGVLRVGNGAQLRPAGRDQKDMTAPEGTTHTCPGDSGSPWLFPRAGDFLAFAVTSGWEFNLGGNVGKATSIFPKFDWLYEASKQSGCNNVECFEEFLDCKLRGQLDDLNFYECFESKRITGSPPSPNTACPQGQHCCQPGDGQCARCIPDDQHCP
jgi:uncharacterized protein affecting Mg2+/Co2+ transport